MLIYDYDQNQDSINQYLDVGNQSEDTANLLCQFISWLSSRRITLNKTLVVADGVQSRNPIIFEKPRNFTNPQGKGFKVDSNNRGWFAGREVTNGKHTYNEYLCNDAIWRSDCSKHSVCFTFQKLMELIGKLSTNPLS